MQHYFTFERFIVNKNKINNLAENITLEVYKIADISRAIHEIISYNADNGIDCGHIIIILEILNKKLSNLIEMCETQELASYNIK